MKYLLLIFPVLLVSVRSHAQTEALKSYTNCDMTFKDGSVIKSMIKERSFLVDGKIFLYKGEAIDTSVIDHITIDSVSYFLRRVESTTRRAFVVVERIVEGQINLYISPRSVAEHELYVEKKNSF